MRTRTAIHCATAAVVLSWVVNARAASGTWNVDASGNWSTAGNWTPVAVPGIAAGDTVGLTFNITAARTVTVDTTSRTMGTLKIGDSGSSYFAYTLTNSGGAGLTFNNSGNGANLVQTNTTAADVIALPMTLADNLTVTNNSTLTLSGAIGGTGNITKTGAGTLTLSGANTQSGDTTVSTGNLTVSGGTFGSTSGTITVGNGAGVAGFAVTAGTVTANTLNVGTIANSTGSTNSVTGSASATFANVNLGSAANTAGSMTIDTSGSVALGAFIDNRDYAAVGPGTANGLIINQGTVTADSVIIQNFASGANMNVNGGSFTIGNSSSTGAFLIGNANSGRGGFLSMSGGSLTYLGTDGLLMATVAGTRAAAIITGGTATLTGITLNQVNVAGMTNWLTVSNGATLYLGNVGLVINQPGATVYAEWGTATVGASADWSSTAPIALIGATTINAADASSVAHNISLSGILSGSGSLTKTGAGQLTLSGANTYAGNTTISGGTLKLGAGNVLPNASALVLNGGTFSNSGHSDTAGALTVQASSTISLGVATTADLTFASGSYTAGTLTISNWTGIAGQSGTGDQIIITATPSATFLTNITFAGYQTGAIRLGTGEIVPSGMLPVNLAITSVNGGFNPTYGTAFSVVVQAQDVNGNAANVLANTVVTLSVNTGTGTLGGTLTGTITAGNSSVTISSVTYSKAESGIVLTATRTSGDSLAAGNSSAFSMNSNLSWYNSGWSYRIAITINHATVAGPLTNFPVLINLTSSSLSQYAQTGGNDLLFTAGDGTNKLAHEIESYTSASGALVAWVNVPLLSSTADTNIYLYYGNPAAASQQNAGGVWDTNFQGVWHLNNSFADSTTNSQNGVNTGTTNALGEISNGRGFNGAAHITVSGLMGSPSNVTLSAWANLISTAANGAEIISLGNCIFVGQLNTSAFGGFYNGSSWASTLSSTNLAGTGWRYVAYAFDNVGHFQGLYLDGVQIASSTLTNSISYAGQGTNTIIGAQGNGLTSYNFNGALDEIRVSKTVRSPAWIATEYANQSSPAAFYSLGSAQPHPPATNYFHFSATSLGPNTGPVNPTNGVTSVGGTGLAAGDLVVFDGLVIDTAPGTNDAWGAVELNQKTNGYYGLKLAQLGALARYTATLTNVCQLWTNSIAAGNFPVGAGAQATNRMRIELTATVAGSTTNMSWAVMIDQGLTGAFTTTLSGAGVTFTNDSIGLTFGSYVDPSLFEDYSIPAITTQPTNQTVTAGGNVTFTVAALGAAPLNYQWYFNGSAVSGAASTSYSLTNVMAANAGNYTVIITNNAGSVTSSVAALTVNKAAGTVTLGSLSQTYNGSAEAATASTTPSGLTVNLTYNGSSSTPANAGSYSVIGTINDANYQGSATNTLVIAAVPVTVASGLTANGKVYDGTTAATISSNNVVLSGVLAGDTANVKLSTNGYSASFGTAGVGTSKVITVSGLSLAGSAAGNYTLTQPTGLTANITAATVTITAGIAANNKTYDGTTIATINSNNVSLSGVVAGDSANVALSTNGYSATFGTAGVGTSKAITVSGLSLAGSAAGNYTLTQPAGLSANITTKTLTAQGTLALTSKVYDGTTTATPTGSAALQSTESAGSGTTADGKPYSVDAVSLTGTATYNFNSKDVASATTLTESGLSLTGTGNGNYTLTAPTLSATITTKALTAQGTLALTSKVYDGTTTATPTGSAALQSTESAGSGTTADGKPYSVDSVSLTGTAAYNFNSKDVASATTVTESGLSLTGTGNGNYTLTAPVLSATITTKVLTVSGITAPSTVYDGTTTAKLGGAAAFQAAETAGSGTTSDGKPYTVDSVAPGGTAAGTLASKNVGAETVTITGVTVTGSGSSNYSVTQQTGLSQTVTAKALMAQGTLALTSKVYDRTTTANPTGAAALQSTESAGSGTTADGKPYSVDSVSLTGTATYNFNSKDVASATTVTESGLSLTGTGNSNYTLTAPTLSATITAKSLTVTGVTANNKVYNGNTTATVNTGGAVLVGVISGDTVTLNTASAAGTFDSASPGLGKTVTVSGLTLGGADAGNYSLTQPTTTANITASILLNTLTGSLKWSAITNGSGPGGQPSSGDTITVYQGATLTVDVTNGVCASIQLGPTSGNGPGTLLFNSNSQVTVSGTVTLGVSGGSSGTFGSVTMTNGGTLICQSLASFNTVSPSIWMPGSGTVQLTANNTLPATVFTNFNNLILPAGTTTTLGMAVTVTNLTQSGGNLALGANPLTVISSHCAGASTVSGTGAYTNISGLFETASPSGVAGNLTTSGTINLAGTFLFDGTSAQVTSAIMPANVSGITVSNAAGVTLSQTTTATNLTLASGNLTTAAYQLNVANTDNSAIAGGSGASYVVGALQKAFGSGTNQAFTFPIGTATVYTPVAISNLNLGGSGLRAITFQSTDGDHPQIGASGITTNQSVNRYWTLTQSGSTFTNYTITFNYLASDLDAEAYPDDFIAQIYTNSVWSSVTVMGTPTSTSTVVTNYSAGSAAFAIGNPVSNQAITFASPGNQTYGVGPITLTATASSGLTVTYSVGGPATVTNNALYITGAGMVSIVALQSGNGVYGPATPVEDDILVSPKTLTVASGIIANNKTYDGVAMATISSNNVSLSGVVAGDSANVALSTNGYSAAFASAAVGNGIGVTVSGLTLTGSAATNYTLTQPSLFANITAAPLTVTANNTNRVYSAANPSFTASYSGFVNGETASFVQGAPGFSTTATTGSPVNSYSITPSLGSLTAPNYSFTTFNNGTLTITEAGSTNVVTTSANPSPTGSNVTFTATLTAVSPGSGTPTGSVQFLADGAALGAPATLSSGVASLTTNSLAHGARVIGAQYAGDGNFFGSTNTLNPNQVINTAPVAASETLSRYPTTGVKARVTALLANDSDPDGDTVSFVSVSATSAQSGAVATNSGWVFYTPPAGYTNTDSFSYVITDGGLQATGAVAVAIVSDTNAAQNIESFQDLGDGSFVTSFFGIPGRTYSIQYTTNLTNPNWQPLGAAAADATGWFQYTDSPGTGTPARFYRSTYP